MKKQVRQSLTRKVSKGLTNLIPLLQSAVPVARKDVINAIPKSDRGKYKSPYYLKKVRDELEGLLKKFYDGSINKREENRINKAYDKAEKSRIETPEKDGKEKGDVINRGWDLFLTVQRWEWLNGLETADEEVFLSDPAVTVSVFFQNTALFRGISVEETKKNRTQINGKEYKNRREGEYPDTLVFINRITMQIEIKFQ